MSSSETLFLVRHFGILVGDQLIAEHKQNENIMDCWELYILLREIVHIINADLITERDLIKLEKLITRHHKLYIKLFGALKPKFHLMLHYVRLMRQNGPLNKMTSMRFESKHRELKRIAQGSSSNINMLVTIATRYLLSFMHCTFDEYKDLNITYGKKQKNMAEYEMKNNFPEIKDAKKFQCFESVTVNNFTYSKSSIVVVYLGDESVEFGKIMNIFVVDDEISFEYTPLYSEYFDMFYFGYPISNVGEANKIVDLRSLHQLTPCLLFNRDEKDLIVTRYRLYIFICKLPL